MIDAATPKTMRAAVIDKPGDPDVFRIAEIPVPLAVTAELVVRVIAAGVNPIDAKTRAGKGTAASIPTWPAVLGSDFSGVVVESPYDAFPLQPGDEVYGMLPVPRVSGSYAEYIAVSGLNLARKPENLDHVQAAGVPLAAMTAWGAVVQTARVRPGQRVLIHAGAGGVGHFAVQFAKLRGAHVITTSSERNSAWLKGLGADETIDYRSTRFEEQASDIDVVIDLIGNAKDDTGTRSLKVLKPGGLIVNVPSGTWATMAQEAEEAGVRATHFKVDGSGATLEQLTAMILDGTVQVHIDEVFPLGDVASAHRSLESGHTRGKIVLDIGVAGASAQP